MPNHCGIMGPGWVPDVNGQCVYSHPTEASTLDVESLDYSQELAGSKLADDWETYFDAYDPTKEQMLGRAAGIDIGQLGAAWGLQSQQLGEQYQEQLGGLFEQAGAGIMDLMSSWGGGGQTMTGRKGRQRKRIGRETSRQAGAYGMGLRQARDTGQLGLQQATTDIYQGLESDIYGERQRWEREQRANLNTLLGMDIWNETGPGNRECVGEGCKEKVHGQECPEGYYLPEFDPNSNLKGCQPVGGANPPDITNTNVDPQMDCIARGGTWNGTSCDIHGIRDEYE